MLNLKACFILLCISFVYVGADFENTLTQPIEETLSFDNTHENKESYNANLKGEGHQKALEDSTSHHPQHDRYEAATSESFASVEYPSSDILNSYATLSEENNITFSHSDAGQALPEVVHEQNLPNYEHIPHETPAEHIHHEEHIDATHYAEPQATFVEDIQATNLEDNIHGHNTDHHPEDHFHVHSHEVASEPQFEQETHHEHLEQPQHFEDNEHVHSHHEHHNIPEHHHQEIHHEHLSQSQHLEDNQHIHSDHELQHHEHVEPGHMHHEEQHSHQKREDTHSHHHHGHSHHHKINKDLKMDPKVWVYSILSTLLISIAPIIILMLVPVENTQSHPNILKTLLSFAAGGLLGDAFLHLIPHALVEYMEMLGAGGDVEKVYHLVGFRILGGIVAFLLVEKVIRILKGESCDQNNHHVIEKWSGSQDDASFGRQTLPMTAAPFDAYVTGDGLRRRGKGNGPLGYESNGHTHHHRTATGGVNEALKTSAYLNLAADFAHNFTDGLAIGASFLAGNSVGFLATCTILLHEVPHEIGDFAILIKSGCSKKKAILLQFLTAVGALSGTICGLAAQEIFSSSTLWILPFTAGGFIYIATVSILPELLEKSSLFQSIKEIIALMAGIYLMVLITMFE